MRWELTRLGDDVVTGSNVLQSGHLYRVEVRDAFGLELVNDVARQIEAGKVAALFGLVGLDVERDLLQRLVGEIVLARICMRLVEAVVAPLVATVAAAATASAASGATAARSAAAAACAAARPAAARPAAGTTAARATAVAARAPVRFR